MQERQPIYNHVIVPANVRRHLQHHADAFVLVMPGHYRSAGMQGQVQQRMYNHAMSPVQKFRGRTTRRPSREPTTVKVLLRTQVQRPVYNHANVSVQVPGRAFARAYVTNRRRSHVCVHVRARVQTHGRARSALTLMSVPTAHSLISIAKCAGTAGPVLEHQPVADNSPRSRSPATNRPRNFGTLRFPWVTD